jgi:hypothetical protein
LPLVALDRSENLWLGQIVIELVHVGAKREAGICVSKEHADLLRVPAIAEEHRPAGVPEAMEADPGLGTKNALRLHPLPEASPDGCWLQYASHEVRGIYPPTALGGEDEFVRLSLALHRPERLRCRLA